jgi:hypothetical protein
MNLGWNKELGAIAYFGDSLNSQVGALGIHLQDSVTNSPLPSRCFAPIHPLHRALLVERGLA